MIAVEIIESVIPFAAIGGLISTGTGMISSFAQANAQKAIQEKAEKDAEESMEKARAALGVNYFEELAIQKEKFELERDATLQAQAGATQALQEGGARALAGGIGRVALAGQQQQAQTRTAMGKELSELQRLTAQEDTRLRDLNVQLDLEEAAGAQLAARNAQEIRGEKLKQGIEGALSFAQQGISLIPLYRQNMAAQRSALSEMAGTDEGLAMLKKQSGMEGIFDPDVQNAISIGRGFGSTGTAQEFFEGMSNRDLRQFKRGLSPKQQAGIFETKEFSDAYKKYLDSDINAFNLRF
tara:strand:+ start:631 stop:1521 length:891 start_codon:yes stop_codon:yes gene_type:complete